ncbi:SLC13 family permease [Planctobacterium marinum]|uniref:Potassium transporter TrkA n=1 Tax=Planctobacterium marinum TaxID=1631968 RepID=A0AA48KS76_9ALTE|nr:potassium transporter TrkA [Planctobacterium marinum]
MEITQILVLGIFLSTILGLVFSNKSPSLIFALATMTLLLTGSLEVNQVLSNLNNRGLVILVLLLLVSIGVDKSRIMKTLARKLITANKTLSTLKVLGISYFSSAILNNTAVVATLTGPLTHNQHIAPSKLLIPLSYAAILGGTVTLVGTSTNLIVDSFLIEHGQPGFRFWDFTLYGLTAGLSCCLLIYLLQGMLPDLKPRANEFKNYIIEAKVVDSSPLIGKSIEENHLRNLPELFLVEIVRKKQLISPVHPDTVIQAGDKLIFSGNIERVDTLDHIPGLSFFADSNGLLRENLTEVIITNRAPIIGKSLKAVGFRSMFDAAVMGIRRDGEKLSGKLGEIKLKAGDFLLLATGADFKTRPYLNNNFFLLNELKVEKKLHGWQDIIAVGGFLSAISLAAFNVLSLELTLLFLLVILVLTRVVSSNELKRSLPTNLIIVIVGALSLSAALENTGTIALLTDWLQPILLGSSPFMVLIAVYLSTLVLTELVTNNAAAALMFPFAWGISTAMNLPIMPFALAVAFAASASFISPWGYQTNLLVFSAGEYRFKDFVRIGLPISAAFSTIILFMLKWQYGF